MSHSLKSIREEYKRTGAFYTSPSLANYLKSFFPPEIKEVYDPTCGDGGLLKSFAEDVSKYGQDINEASIEIAKKELVNFEGFCGDTLDNPHWINKKFNAIVANPPFSIKWSGEDNPKNKEDIRFKLAPALAPKSKADYAFLLHILHYLSDDGMAVVLCFPGILYRGNSEGKIRKWLVEQNYIDTIISIPPNEFEDTSISTALLILRKNKKTSSIRFLDKESNLERTVSFEEIQKNDFTLSVSTYVEKEEPKEEIDIRALNQEAEDSIIADTVKSVEYNRALHEQFPEDFTCSFKEFMDRLLTNLNLILKEAK